MKTAHFTRETKSPCPVCLKMLTAQVVMRGGSWYLEKACSEHGVFSTVIWRGEPSLENWGDYHPPRESDEPDCPHACGLCERHLQKTCCVLVEVTKRCNLGCPYCFAVSGAAEDEKTPEEYREIFKALVREGRTFVHLSGGEPTVRDDLPEIVKAAADAGCAYIQLNSNGLRIAEEPEYLAALKKAGLSFVFMQFDGLDDTIYERLRGRPLLEKKLQAVENMRKVGIGVTLVPMVVPGVNDGQLGDIVRFATKNSPIVRGVHFQPVSYFGRYPSPPKNEQRITLPEILVGLERQTNGMVKVKDILPSKCDHPRCGFHADFLVTGNTLKAANPTGNRGVTDQAARNRRYIGLRWKYREGGNADGFDAFLTNRLTLTGMAFQDAYNLDTERLRRCSLHVYRDGKIIPFCANYLTGETE